MRNLMSELGAFIGEATASTVSRTDLNRVFNRLVPEAKLERLLAPFGDEVAAESEFVWNDLLDAFTLSLSNLVDVQGVIATQAKKRIRAGVMGKGGSPFMGQREDREAFAAEVTEALVDAILPEASDVPKEGKARAQKRMDDAAKRGGIDKMIQATLQRIKATSEPGKLEGIVSAVDELIRQLERVKAAAERAAS